MTKEEALAKIKELEQFVKQCEEVVGFEDDEIFLLSKEEYEKYKVKIPKSGGWWWLRSPGRSSNNAADVNYDGSVNYYGFYVYSAHGYVRPALKLSNLESSHFEIGERIDKYHFPWIKIGEDVAIAEVAIGMHMFDRESNAYETSKIRRWLKAWLENRK